MEEEWRHASPEGLRSEKDAVSIVKHDENEKSATTTTKKHSKIDFFDFRISCSLCFHSQHVRDLTLYHVFLVPLFLIFIFIVFSQSTFSRPDTLPCVLGNRSYRVIFFLLFDTPLS